MFRAAHAVSLLAFAFCVGSTALLLAEDGVGLKVLVTHGGHGFDQKAFFAVFDKMEAVEYDVAKLPDQADLLTPALAKKYDAIVMYDMVPGISPAQQEQFLALLKTGIGVVSLHHNIGAHRQWLEYRQVVGGAWLFEPQTINGKDYSKSTFAHGEELTVRPVGDHPIARGLKAFSVKDETYGGLYHAPGVTVVLETDHAKNDRPIAWTTSYGNSKVFYLQLGHDAHVYHHPMFGAVIRRGIAWVSQ